MNLTQARLKEVLRYEPESGNFFWIEKYSQRKIGVQAGWTGSYGYRRIALSGTDYQAHRLAWLYVYGKPPNGQIDHINHDTSDNRISNLRDVSPKNNQRNRTIGRNNSSGVIGVCWRKSRNKWRALVMVDREQICLGHFEDFFEACCARMSANMKYNFHENHGRAL